MDRKAVIREYGMFVRDRISCSRDWRTAVAIVKEPRDIDAALAAAKTALAELEKIVAGK